MSNSKASGEASEIDETWACGQLAKQCPGHQLSQWGNAGSKLLALMFSCSFPIKKNFEPNSSHGLPASSDLEPRMI